jgi:hypothetical protein
MKPSVSLLFESGCWWIYPPLQPRVLGAEASEGGLLGAFKTGIQLGLFAPKEKVRVQSGDWLMQDMDSEEAIEFAAIKRF